MADRKHTIMFLAADYDGDGTVSFSSSSLSLLSLRSKHFRSLKTQVSADDLKMFFKACGRVLSDKDVEDLGAKGGLNHEQFQEMMNKMKSNCIENAKLNEALLVFDRGGAGDVAVDDLNKAMKTMGDQPFGDEEAAELKLWFDVDGDGKFRPDEFTNAYTALKLPEGA
jgi:Ca2+-binding EF-hand superfamily protein